MTVRELINLNQNITDISIEVRVDGHILLDELNIGLDYGVEPRFPTMCPIDIKHINNIGANKKKAMYIRGSINAWDDGKDYWQVKPERLPKGWLELEVFSWTSRPVFKTHHPRYAHGSLGCYEGIRIVALPNGEKLTEEPTEKKEKQIDGQMSLFQESPN